MRRFFGAVLPFNWGDELNKYFIEYVTGKKVACIGYNFPMRRYVMIGSILGYYNLNKTTVYGSGLLTASGITGRPEKIISVRGPLTRKVLLSKGIYCPECYGDPALLLPLFYSPRYREHKYISVIPHWRSFVCAGNLFPLRELTEKYKCHMINITSYKKWTDIIDEIAGSSFVIAESLHGLITAETYKVPCIWAAFTDHTTGMFNSNGDWDFKFHDFYESIGKHDMNDEETL